MALQVWLPLDGTLNNNGLSNLIFENLGASNTTVSTTGKIGSCYQNNAFTAGGMRSNTTIDLGINQSMFCWVNFTTLNSSSSLGGSLVSQHRYVNNTGMGLTIKYVSSTTGYLSVNTGNGSSRTYNTYCATTLMNAGTWYHVGYTYDGAQIKLYVNGVCEKTQAYTGMSVPADYLVVFCWSMNAASGNAVQSTYNLNGKLNDVRIYDHCLTPSEVKEISQGLVLHYQFDDTYSEITTNLYSGTFSNTCYNGATNKYSYGTTTDIYKTIGNFQGKESVKVYMGTAGLSAYPYIYFDAFNTAGTAVHTLSFDYYPTSQTSIVPYSYNGSYNISYITSNGAHDSKTNVNSIVIPVITNQWNHVAITMQKYDTTDTSRGNGYIRIGSASHTSTTSDYWLFANIQVEAKNHETGYAAPGTTRSNVQIYDSSGYGHNGTIINNPILNTPSPRYRACMHFDAKNQKVQCGVLNTAAFGNSYSFAWWAKMVSNGPMHWGFSDGIRLNGLYSGTLWNTGDSSNNPLYNPGTTTQVTAPTTQTWHHFVMTGNGTKCYVYKDGVLWAEAKTYKAISGTQIFINGWAANDTNYASDNYSISDFHIYATALSADDVKKLYETSMIIDSAGNISARLLN